MKSIKFPKLTDEVFTQKFIPPKTDGSGNIRKNLRIAASLLSDSGWTLIDGDRVQL